MLRAYKCRLETNDKQASFFSRCAGIARKAYNWGVADCKRQFEAGEKINVGESCKAFNAIKKEQFPFMSEVPYECVGQEFYQLRKAYANFYRRLKSGIPLKEAGLPKFKCKHKQEDRNFTIRRVKIESDRIFISKLGPKHAWIMLSQRDYIPVGPDVKYGVDFSISFRAGHWFISVLVDDGLEKPEPKNTGKVHGVDVGVNKMAVFDDDEEFANPRATYRLARKLARLEREKARRVKGSNNRKKTVAKIAKVHYKIANVRRHAQHAVSNYAVKEVDMVVLEDLNVAGMVKSRSMAKSVSDVGFGEIRRQIEYKAERAGVGVVPADRFYPSSQICSNCGSKKKLKRGDRVYTCAECGLKIDRDLNAAKNLAALA